MRMRQVLSCVVLIACARVASAVVRHVPQEYSSIQRAIDAAADGDTVLVAPGIYYETINFAGKNITVTGTDPNDPRVVGYTIINADGDGTVVTFENRETPDAVLRGFTITGGTGTLAYEFDDWKEFHGAGICCRGGASPTITRNVIANNHAPYSEERLPDGRYTFTFSEGGGILVMGGDSRITHNLIYDNSAYIGGGIYASGGTVRDNIIYHNSAGDAGGVYIYRGVLLNNTIVGNDCSKRPEYGRGGNVYSRFSHYNVDSLIVANNIIANAESGGGICYGDGAPDDAIRFNDVWNNLPYNYAGEDARTYDLIVGPEADYTGRFGNISEDPLFVSVWNNDYHIDPLSPCVSAGDPDFAAPSGAMDIDGDPRVFAVRVDIGADEHIGYVKPLARAGADQHVLAPEPVKLDGSSSYFSDPCGLSSYEWTQTDGPDVELSDAAAVDPVFTPPTEGWYIFQLVVGDGQYVSGPDRVLVVVGNEQPVANAGADRLWPTPGPVRLDGSGSHDADPPDKLAYTWTQVDGPPVVLQDADSVAPFFEDAQAGIYLFQVVVSDGFVESEVDTVKVEVSPFTVGARPFEVTNWDQGDYYYPALTGTKVVHSGSEAYDPSTWAIYCVDVKTGRVDMFEGVGIDLMPQIDAGKIVWASGGGRYYSPMCTSLLLGDLATGETRYLKAATMTDSFGYPAISGNKVVWRHHHDVDTDDYERFHNSPFDICGADISNPEAPVFFMIAEDAGRGVPYPFDDYRRAHDESLAISGDVVVWEKDGDLFGADISDLGAIETFSICTAPERQYAPAVSGSLVVWADERNDVGDIYGADISDPNNVREFEICVDPGWQLRPDIDGRLVAFHEGDAYYGRVRTCYLSRDYGPIHFLLPESYRYDGTGLHVDGTSIVWEYSGSIRGVTVEFGYELTDGPVQNAATGRRYESIQHGVATAVAGDVIVVEPGAYAEKLRFAGKAVTVTSADPEDRDVCATTIITGDGQLVTFADQESREAMLAGFTVRGGSYGLYCSGTSPTVTHCRFTDSTGAGVKLWDAAEPRLACCEIIANGAGVEMWSYRWGRFVNHNRATLRNCLITGNRGDGVRGGYVTADNCTIADNAGCGITGVGPTVANSIIYFNDSNGEALESETTDISVTFSDVQGGWGGQGNIDADPLFVSRGHWVEQPAGNGSVWVPGDYHLRSHGWSWNTVQRAWTWDSVTSPCIDAGDPSAPLGDELCCEAGDPLSERAGANTRINMGVYGGRLEASLAPHSGMP